MDEGRKPDDPRASSAGLPWPLSELDTSQAATRRRGLRFFHVVLLVLGGGTGLVVLGSWIVVLLVVGVVAYMAFIQRGGYPDLVGAVDRMGTQLTEMYANIQQANQQPESGDDGLTAPAVAVEHPAAAIHEARSPGNPSGPGSARAE